MKRRRRTDSPLLKATSLEEMKRLKRENPNATITLVFRHQQTQLRLEETSNATDTSSN